MNYLKKNYKQITFLTSFINITFQTLYRLGYNGSKVLTEYMLSEEQNIIKLEVPIVVNSQKFIWVDSEKNFYSSDDVLMNNNKLIGKF